MTAPADVEALVAAIRTTAAVAAMAARPVIVGVDGPSGAGKSTLAALLVRRLPDQPAAIIEGDDFYADIDWTVRARFSPAEASARNYDYQRLREQVLAPARAGDRRLCYQLYDWDNERMGAWVELAVPAVLVVEGVHLLRPELRDLVDVGIYVEAGRDLRIARQHARHGTYEPAIAMRQNAMIELWEAAYSHYLETCDPASGADFRFSGGDEIV